MSCNRRSPARSPADYPLWPSWSPGSRLLSAKAVQNASLPACSSALAWPSPPSIFSPGCFRPEWLPTMVSTYQRRINPVQRSLSRPLTILGVERKLFFFAMCLGAATFNLLNSLSGGVLIFLLLYFVARWATATDPQILKLLLQAAKLRREYDPLKWSALTVVRGQRC